MTCGDSSIVIDGEEEREDFKAMELYLESPFNVDVDIMPLSEVEKIFRAFAEKRKAELPRFTPDGIPITLENKFDDAIYNYLYKYWKEQSGEYDPKKDVIPESEMNKMHPKTKNEKKFEQWLLQQYGMTKKEEREYTVKGNLESLWEIFSAADMVLFARGLPSIGKNLAKLGKNVGNDVAEEAIEKTVQKEAAEEMAESTAKKEMADTAEDLSQKTVDKDDVLEDSSGIKRGSGTSNGLIKEGLGKISGKEYTVTEKGIENVRKYLTEQGFIEDYENQAMLKRLENALANGQKITGADAVFYTHELKEAQLVLSGMEQTVAHQAALNYYGVSPFSVYHPEVIQLQPGWWNKAWFDFWNIER